MKDSYKDGIIYSNKEISTNIYEIVLQGDFKGRPGQFYMVKGWNSSDPFLPRPLSISNLENDKLTFLYESKGKGTQILSKLKKGDILSILGPLGNGFDLEEKRKIAIISGGIGIAPMLYLVKNLKGKVDLYSGFRSGSYFTDRINPYVNDVNISTEDGSVGHKGFVTDLFDPNKYDLVLSCGPTPMMEVVIKMCKNVVPVYISMESRMACGIGACLGCTIETTRGMERVCKEGPVFKSEEVILND